MEYGIIGQQPEGVNAVLRPTNYKGVALGNLDLVVDDHEIGRVQRLRVNRPRKDGAGVSSSLKWCCFSSGWAPGGIDVDLFGETADGYPIGEGFDDRMEAAIALLEVWDREGRP